MKLIAVLVTLVVLAGPAPASAQGDPSITSAEPFKLGTFDIDGEPRIGIVLRDDAGRRPRGREPRACSATPPIPPIPMPATMVDLIGRYEYGMKTRLYEIVNHLVRGNRLDRRAAAGVGARREGGRHPGAADARQDAERRRQLLHPRRRDRHRRGAEEGRGRAPGQARRAVPVPQADARRGRRRRRRRDHPARPRSRRLGSRARHRHRPHGASTCRPTRPPTTSSATWSRSTSRIAAAARRRFAPRLRLARRQGPRHLRADGPVDRAEGVLRRPDEAPAPDAERRRQGDAGGRRGRHDPLDLRADRVRLVDHHALSRATSSTTARRAAPGWARPTAAPSAS